LWYQDVRDFSNAAFTEIGYTHVRQPESWKVAVRSIKHTEINVELVASPNASSQQWIKMVNINIHLYLLGSLTSRGKNLIHFKLKSNQKRFFANRVLEYLSTWKSVTLYIPRSGFERIYRYLNSPFQYHHYQHHLFLFIHRYVYNTLKVL
jgi:hypothetical protein